MALQPFLLSAFGGLKSLTEEIDGHALTSGGGDDILFGAIIGRDGDLVLRSVSDREALDDIVGGLATTRVDDLETGGGPLFGEGRSPTVEDNHDALTRKIPILGEASHQFRISTAGDATMQVEQFIPAVDDIVPVDQ